MERPADFEVLETEAGRTAVLSGDWTAAALHDAGARLTDMLDGAPATVLDMYAVTRLDTAGAYALVRAAGVRFEALELRAKPGAQRLLKLVAEAVAAQKPARPQPGGLLAFLARIGLGMVNVGREFYGTLVFGGHLLTVLGRILVNPRRMRWAACISLAERAGLDAIPIVATTTFFIGAVVGLLGANMLQQFGAQVFAVELIGIAVLREFNIIITAVLLAGRSASSFAAEIGSMKMSQEIDAIKVLGVDPFEALVVPRFFALLLTIPLLTFVATLAGLLGGLLITWSVLDLGPSFFLQRIVDNVGATHFWVGLSKAPVMAMAIAGIGCRQGMEVGGDVESLGRRVTAAVVHAIFAIILIDALFALLYMELDI
jgi:phospholipid/cholesterol/gamma-HCH transport system permease protein